MPGLMEVTPSGLVYQGETDEQAAERDRATAKWNARVLRDRESAQKAMDEPAKFYHRWCRKYAPHLLAARRREK